MVFNNLKTIKYYGLQNFLLKEIQPRTLRVSSERKGEDEQGGVQGLPQRHENIRQERKPRSHAA
jgi:hypothetical protein